MGAGFLNALRSVRSGHRADVRALLNAPPVTAFVALKQGSRPSAPV